MKLGHHCRNCLKEVPGRGSVYDGRKFCNVRCVNEWLKASALRKKAKQFLSWLYA
jgi:hypothetical protein